MIQSPFNNWIHQIETKSSTYMPFGETQMLKFNRNLKHNARLPRISMQQNQNDHLLFLILLDLLAAVSIVWLHPPLHILFPHLLELYAGLVFLLPYCPFLLSLHCYLFLHYSVSESFSTPRIIPHTSLPYLHPMFPLILSSHSSCLHGFTVQCWRWHNLYF
jgi:hypothetical protein